MSEVALNSLLVAVIAPAYGGADLLGEALTALQAHTMTEWECMAIDDGAPNDAADAAAPFLADPRTRFTYLDATPA